MLHRSENRDRKPRRFTTRALLATAIVAGALTGPMAAYAANQFSDVPDDHPFVNEISWLANTGISEGYPDGEFHPTDPVTRQEMAAFLQRSFYLTAGLTEATSSTNTSTTSATTWQNLPGAELSVEIPEGTTGRILARFNAESVCTGPSLKYCQVRILVDGAPIGPWATVAFDSTEDGTATASNWEAHGIERASNDLWSGIYSVAVQYRTTGLGFADATSTLDDWTFVAEVALNDAFLP